MTERASALLRTGWTNPKDSFLEDPAETVKPKVRPVKRKVIITNYCNLLNTQQNQATGYALCNPAYLMPDPSQDKWEGSGRNGIRCKNGGKGDGGGSLIGPDGVAPSWTVGVSASVIFPCTRKSRRRFLLAPAHPGSWKKGRKTVVCVCVCVLIQNKCV